MYFVGCSKLKKQKWNYSDPYSTEYIVALNDSNMVSGRVYMRRGYVEENLYYQYLVKRSDGGFVANKVNTDHTTLYFSDGNYRVEWLEKERHVKHTSIYLYANNTTIKNRLIKRGDSKDEAERRLKSDNRDFKDAQSLAQKIVYNNAGARLEDVCNKILEYMETNN